MPSWFIFVLIGLVGGVTAGTFGRRLQRRGYRERSTNVEACQHGPPDVTVHARRNA